jgi:hypothetical protein
MKKETFENNESRQKKTCPNCGSTKIQKRGQRRNGNQYFCHRCKTYPFIKDSEELEEDDQYSYQEEGERAIICATLDEDAIKTDANLIKALNIDVNIWEIYKKKIGKQPAWRKDRKVDWIVENGEVLSGEVHDSGKIKVVPVFVVQVWLRRKTELIRVKPEIETLLAELRSNAPKVPKIKYPTLPNGLLYEVMIPDIHFGKLTWNDESGQDYDIKIAETAVKNALARLLLYCEKYDIKKILIPIGNDFFNTDNKEETTTHGTPQQEDTRWSKTFRKGHQLARYMIDQCALIAPVDVMIIQGNHDEQRTFYLGEVIDAVYSKNPNVTVDNRTKKRKYYAFGKNLIGFTHGYWEAYEKKLNLMPYEAPDLWAKSLWREWHTGDKHHEEKINVTTSESIGIVMRIIRSLSAADCWHFDKGFIGAIQAAEGFLWHPEEGLIAQFNALGV